MTEPVKLHLQDPSDEGTIYMLDVVLDALESGNRGGAAFAFVSKRGIELLLKSNAFKTFSRESFTLIVGLDSITNRDTIEALQKVQSEIPALKMFAFLHRRPSAIFHPKFIWVRQRHNGRVLTGSGNLTKGGLIGNWEAFCETTVSLDDLGRVEKLWNDWLGRNRSSLKKLDDPDVLSRAELNKRIVLPALKDLMKPGRESATVPEVEGVTEEETPRVTEDSPALIAEIPRGSTRWNQANFPLAAFRDFFGASPGKQKRVFLYHVRADGTLPQIPEVRPSVSVKSHNFRFELGAGAGIPYPNDGRPIGIFIKAATRTFLYLILMPGDSGYSNISALFGPPTAGRMRQVRGSLKTLKERWPSSPLEKVTA